LPAALCAIAEASLRRSILITAAVGGLRSPASGRGKKATKGVSHWEQRAFAENLVTDRLRPGETIGTKANQRMSEAQNTASGAASETRPIRLRDALRQARIEAADRTGVVVDLRDAEVARLEILNEALDPLFAQVPDTIDLFDRGISNGETPRLWVDVVAHVV